MMLLGILEAFKKSLNAKVYRFPFSLLSLLGFRSCGLGSRLSHCLSHRLGPWLGYWLGSGLSNRFGHRRLVGCNRAGDGTPYFTGILLDGPVAGEFANGGNVVNNHIHPLLAIGVGLGDPILAFDVGLVVSQQAVPVGGGTVV